MEVGRALLLLALAILVVGCLAAVVVLRRRAGGRGTPRRGGDGRSALRHRSDEPVVRHRRGARLDRVTGAWAGWRARRHERRTIARLDRAVEAESLTRDVDLTEFDRDDRRPLEQIAADLWRLREYRVGRGGRPIVWPLLLIQAYDDRLRLACRCLGITEHLGDLEGVDREIERVRVEGLLHAAGLPLPAAVADHRQRHH